MSMYDRDWYGEGTTEEYRKKKQLNQSQKFKTYYDILRVQNNATKETIEAAYRSLIIRTEENRRRGIPISFDEAPETLYRAYAMLTDDQKRSEYDRDIQINLKTYNLPEFGMQQNVYYRNAYVPPVAPAKKPSLWTKKVSPLWILVALVVIFLGCKQILENGSLDPTKWNLSQAVKTVPKLNYDIPGSVTKYTLPGNENLQEEPMPDNGAVFMGAELLGNFDQPQKGYAPFSVEAPEGETGFYIKLKDAATNKDRIILFLRSGASVKYSLPLGTYKFLYASGTKWYGGGDLFGETTSYYRAQKDITLYQANETTSRGITIKLFKTPNGNMKEDPVSKKDF